MLGAVSMTGCEEKSSGYEFTAMDTYVTFKGEITDSAYNAAKTAIEDLSKVIDCHSESELPTLNTDGKLECSTALKEAVYYALHYYNYTETAFNPCYYDLKNIWKLDDASAALPTDAEIADAMKYTDATKIDFTGKSVTLNGAKFDFGGFGKGLAADKAIDALRDNNVRSALISIGGTVATIGSNNGEQWKIAVQDPRGENGEQLGVLKIRTSFISTSGDYQQYKTVDGKRYHHIFGYDGKPTDNGVISVTVIGANGVESDAMSTALFVMGKDKALEFCDANNLDAIIVTSDKTVTITNGLNKKFELTSDDYTLKVHKSTQTTTEG